MSRSKGSLNKHKKEKPVKEKKKRGRQATPKTISTSNG